MSNTNIIKLLFVSKDNNNKFYHMTKVEGESTFNVEYGRVGYDPRKETYPLSKWSTKYNEKIKKGYKDVTEISTVTKTKDNVKISDEKEVEELILKLQQFANVNVTNTYLINSHQVTKIQLDLAQKHVDNLSTSFKNYFGKISWDFNSFNKELLKLYTVIPRKMKKVQDHLIKNDSTKDEILHLISNEQDNLDSLVSQYNTNNVVETDEVTNSEDLLTSLGLSITANISNDEMKEIKKLMQENDHRISKVFKVENHKTENIYKTHLNSAKNKNTKLYFHGSRNQNFWFILQQGLKIRPSGAVYTGSMFGDGVYFANKAQKSIGYTSLSGSYWAGGNSNIGYLALFEIHEGNAKNIHKHNSDCYSLNYSKIQREGYDSVFAHKGADLRNDEIIIYNSIQCTIKYLIEIK